MSIDDSYHKFSFIVVNSELDTFEIMKMALFFMQLELYLIGNMRCYTLPA